MQVKVSQMQVTFFVRDEFINFIGTRKVACLNCATCSTGVFTPDSVLQCENLGLCGPLERCLVTRKSGAWDEAPQTRYQISEQGKKLAAAARVGDIVGA